MGKIIDPFYAALFSEYEWINATFWLYLKVRELGLVSRPEYKVKHPSWKPVQLKNLVLGPGAIILPTIKPGRGEPTRCGGLNATTPTQERIGTRPYTMGPW